MPLALSLTKYYQTTKESTTLPYTMAALQSFFSNLIQDQSLDDSIEIVMDNASGLSDSSSRSMQRSWRRLEDQDDDDEADYDYITDDDDVLLADVIDQALDVIQTTKEERSHHRHQSPLVADDERSIVTSTPETLEQQLVAVPPPPQPLLHSPSNRWGASPNKCNEQLDCFVWSQICSRLSRHQKTSLLYQR